MIEPGFGMVILVSLLTTILVVVAIAVGNLVHPWRGRAGAETGTRRDDDRRQVANRIAALS